MIECSRSSGHMDDGWSGWTKHCSAGAERWTVPTLDDCEIVDRFVRQLFDAMSRWIGEQCAPQERRQAANVHTNTDKGAVRAVSISLETTAAFNCCRLPVTNQNQTWVSSRSQQIAFIRNTSSHAAR